jgi:hypothetical protein
MAQRIIPTGAAEQGTPQVTVYAAPSAPTGIPVVYHDLSRERRDKDGKLVKATA